MICTDTNASTKFNIISQLCPISWSQKGAGRICSHHKRRSIWNAGSLCPAAVKANSVIIFHLYHLELARWLKTHVRFKYFHYGCLFSVSDFQRINMIVQSDLIPDSYLFCFFLSCENLKLVLHFTVKKLYGLCFFNSLEIPQFVSLKWYFPQHFKKWIDQL